MGTNKAILLAALFFVSCSSYGKKQPEARNGHNGFAVVELFTSEGCSSCPAAEAVLRQVHDAYKENVFVMEFHVDYWNYLGWKDMYSSSEYTERQRVYAKLFHLNSTYTPQAVVNGKHELVGSDKGALEDLIKDGLSGKASDILQLSATENGGDITVAYTLLDNRSELLNLVLVQKKAETNVRRGENEGRKLEHINVVSALKTIDVNQKQGVVNIALPQGVRVTDCSVIAFMQEKDNWGVTGAAESEIK